MQTLEALLEKRIPDDYMKNYKKTYSSKVQSNTNKVRTESNECDQPMPNGDNLVANPNDTNSLVKTMPLTALSYNGVSGNGNLKLTANVLLSPERGHSYLKQGSVQIRSVGSNSRIVSNHQRKILPAINGVPTEEAIRLAVPSLTSDGRKKFKITTVPKVVPLINTVGNQSKLLPFQASEMGHNSILSVSPELKSAGKSSSILEARLSTRQVAGPASSSDSELNSMSKDNGVLESPESTELHASTTPSEKVSQSQGYMVQKNRKTTISFERGATRIVSTKAKNTQTVDIGVQVYMPEPDADIEGNTVCLSNQMPPLQPISTSTSGRATAISTMPTNEYVILNTKNGKRILTIPKQMTGTKTFVIDGKSTTISQPSNGYLTSAKSIFMSDSHLCQNKSNLSTAASLSCDTVTTPSSSGQLSIPSPLQVPSNNPVILSVATSTGASHNIQTVGALNYNQIISSDRLVLPLNSPVTFDGKLCSVDSTVDPAVSSQSSFQFNTHNSDSIVLPLNSPIKPSSISRLNSNDVHTIPNTTSLFILVPNEQATSNNIEHETSEDISDKINVLKRKVNGLKNEILLSKKRCLELSKTSRGACEAPTREGIQQHPHGPAHISPENAVNANSKVSSAPISKEDINISVKNAFSEFRNCLIADKDGKLPIHSAVENNDIIAVRRQCILLRARRSSVDVVTSKEETPLQLALYHGHSSIAAILLQHGADASVIDQEGNTALHLAVMYAEEVFESLLLPGQSPEAFVNNLNDEGFSALHLAAQCDKVTAIKWLLNHGAIVDLPDGKCGRTALFIAIERKSYRAQKALLACGADMREPTFSGSTPFLLTKADTIAHLTSGQDAVAEFIDSDALLRSSSLPEDN